MLSVGFIDVGMVGLFDRGIRKRLFYFFYSVVTVSGNAAVSLTTPSRNSDVDGLQCGRACNRLWVPPACGLYLRGHSAVDSAGSEQSD